MAFGCAGRSRILMSNRLVIEKGVPIPEPRKGTRAGPKRRWPFRQMDPYDSFYVRTDSPDRACRLAYIAATRMGIRISVRTQPEGIRIWRLPDDGEG